MRSETGTAIDIRQCICQIGDVAESGTELPVLGGLSACCMPLVAAPLSAEAAQRLARVLKTLADPARLRLVSLIAAHEGGEACVCDLTKPLGLTQPTVSHHLKQLTDAGLLERDKRGVWAYYRLVPGALEQVAALINSTSLRTASRGSADARIPRV